VNQLKSSLDRMKRYLLTNPGAMFIIGFNVLILTCAFLLIENNPLISDAAFFAYCFLFIGVVLQAIGFLKAEGHGCEPS